MDLKIIKPEKEVKEALPIKGRMPAEPKQYDTPKVELSENIQKFDKKPRVIVKNPYDYNSISLKKDTLYTPTASEMIVNPLYNQVGKALGVDTIHDWNRYYDKVQKIVEWAKEETNYQDTDKLVSWIYKESQKASSLGAKKIDDLYIYTKLKTPEKVNKRPKTKVIIKKVYVKEKLSTSEMLNRIIKGQ